MIIVNCALRQDDIIKIVESITIENINIFKHVTSEGIRIFFRCNYFLHKEKACNMAHTAISNTPLGKALQFNVIDINEYPWIKYPYY